MGSLYETLNWKTASIQELKDQTKKLRHGNDMMDLQNTVRDSIRAETLKEGITLKIENEDGQIFFRPRGTMMGNSALNIELKNKGVRGNIYVGPAASCWFTGGWAKALVLAGTVYLYRNELRIIGRGVLAGANLAVERWEQYQRQQDDDGKGKEVEEEKEQEKEEEKTSVTPTGEKGINQSASAYPNLPPIQPPRGLHESSCARFFDPRSPPYPAPYCRPRDPVHTPAPDALATGDIDASGNFDRTKFCGSSTDGDDVIVPPNSPYDSSGFDADMNVSEEESVVL